MKIIAMLCIMFLVALLPAYGGIEGTAPFGETDVPENDPLLLKAIFGYQKHISPVIGGGRCPMYPSCSGFSADAIKAHGPLKGWIMTCDRLMRCGRDELNLGRSVRIDNSELCYDPISENDLWNKK